MTAADERGLQASGLRVEAGMDNGGIGLRGAGADIVGALEQHGAQSIAGQLATDGGADHAGPDDDDVVAPIVGHGDCGGSGPGETSHGALEPRQPLAGLGGAHHRLVAGVGWVPADDVIERPSGSSPEPGQCADAGRSGMGRGGDLDGNLQQVGLHLHQHP